MNIFIYSDESGVFDKAHNSFFVFGGLVFLSKEERDVFSRKYIKAERDVRQKAGIPSSLEVKAATISNTNKGKLYRSLNQAEKFGIVVNQKTLFDSVFNSKKTKQRYLDWAFKVAIKKKLEALILEGKIVPEEVEHLYFIIDEHTTATDGIYELRQSLEQEFRFGTYNFERMIHYPPLFKNLLEVQVKFCDSKTQTLVRAADIVSNKLYYMAIINDYSSAKNRHFYIYHHP